MKIWSFKDKSIFCFFEVLGICLLARSCLPDVNPIDFEKKKAVKDALELLSVVLGILAAGCTAAFFSFSYKDARDEEGFFVRIMSWSLIIAFSFLVFLCMYCLQMVGAFHHLDIWIKWLVFWGTFFMLCGLILIEIWDATCLDEKKKNCPHCKSWISQEATKCPKCTSDLS